MISLGHCLSINDYIFYLMTISLRFVKPKDKVVTFSLCGTGSGRPHASLCIILEIDCYQGSHIYIFCVCKKFMILYPTIAKKILKRYCLNSIVLLHAIQNVVFKMPI
jgi:hypothetical protein